MGKSRGSKYGYKGNKGRAAGKGAEDGSDSSEEEQRPRMGQQKSNVGMMPPSDSESEGSEEEGAAPKAAKPAQTSGSNQRSNVGMMPPSDSDGSGDEGGPNAAYLRAAPQPRKKAADPALDPEQIRKDIERLELIKRRREEERLKRIEREGWDRFATVSETNKPPAGFKAAARVSDSDSD